MKDQNDQPGDKSEKAARQRDQHQPTQNAQRIQKVAIILPTDNAGMHRTFIHSAAECIGDDTAQDHRPDRCKREYQDESQKDPIKNPRKPLRNR